MKDEDRKAFEGFLKDEGVSSRRMPDMPGFYAEHDARCLAAGFTAALAHRDAETARDQTQDDLAMRLAEAAEVIDAMALDMGDYFQVPHHHFSQLRTLAVEIKAEQGGE